MPQMNALRDWANDHLGVSLTLGDDDFTLTRVTPDGDAILKDVDGQPRRMALRSVRDRFMRQNLAMAAEGGSL